MNLNNHIAKHIRELHFGGNWTDSNLKDQLADVTWKQATIQVYDLNSIALLVFHINYYIEAVLKVLKGGPLEAHDKYSFDCPAIQSKEDWGNLGNKAFSEANELANLVEELPESKLWEYMADEKYGSYFHNLLGTIEHSYYHLGQIALIKKIITEQSSIKS